MTTPVRLLPLLTRSHEGGRSSMTCLYRCGDACDQPVPNTSDNEYFGDLVAAGVSRRAALRAGGAGAALVGLTAWSMPSAAAAAASPAAPAVPASKPLRGSALGFTGIAPTPATVDEVKVPQGFDWAPIISWGDPLFRHTPAFDFDNQTAAAQREQAGYNADYTQFMLGGPGNKRPNEGLLAFNNEYTNDELMFRGVKSSADLTEDQLEIVLAAHGITITEVARRNAKTPWRWVQGGKRNRRLHTDTPFSVDGPAAGSVHLKTSEDPTGKRVLGTLNNCAGGETPWGTYLSGEENFNQYFNATDAPDTDGKLKRYGITSAGRGWERVRDRFSVVDEPNEVNRFGWIVEVDAEDPSSTPVKHTALGRFKHEGATVTLTADGRVAAYMGDDERYDYIYKFISKNAYKKGNKKHNMTLLSEGDLYVAKLNGDGAADGEYDGTGHWIPLVVDGLSHVTGFTTEEVLIWTRLAADKVGPTKMDRPEDVQPNPVNGRIYAAMTNNTARTPSEIDEANPRAANKHGHVTEFTERGGDHGALTFTWKIVLVAGDPTDPQTYFNGYDKSEVSPISCPDNVAFDAKGNLWISTDGMPGTLKYCDALYVMPLEGADKGKLQQFLSVPVGAETCGPTILGPDSVIVSVQHPGEVSGASPENVISQFPYRGDGQPRPSVIHAYRRQGK